GDINGASLQATVNVATGVNWSVVSGGTGSFSANANILNPTFIPSTTLKNNGGKVILRARTTGNGICNAVEDTVSVTINPIPRITSVGDPLIMCEDNDGVGLGIGSFTGAPEAFWTTSGKGVVANNGTLSATYLPSEEDIKAGQVTLTLVTDPGNTTCRSVSANRILTITKAPEVNAGPDFELCTDIDTIRLSGSVTNASGVYWRALSGGVFVDDNVGEAKFVPVSTANAITFILSSTGNGACNEAIDSVQVSFSPGPQIFAGNDFTVCNTNLPFRLNGSGTRGRWTILQGSGTFEPNDSTLNATFVPSNSNVGTYRFRLTPISTCATLTDDVEVSVIQGPVPTVPSDFNVCDNINSPITINGSVTLGAGVRWLTNGSGTFSSENNATTQYTPSDADKVSGSVTLTLQTIQDANCRPISDVVVISFDKAPEIFAGVNKDFCENINTLNLEASVEVASGVNWTNLTSGNLPQNPNSLTSIYNVQQSDRDNGLVRFLATSTGNVGSCNHVTDTVTFTLKPLNTVNAGTDLVVCKSVDFIEVSGTFQNAGGVVWTSKGDGRFTPDSVSLTSRYFPSSTDKENNSVVLKITTTNNGLCPEVSDSLEVSFIEPRGVFAGNDTLVCANIETFQFVPSKNAFTNNVVWSTLGTGTFVDSTVLNAVYIPSQADRDNGAVALKISSKDVSECDNVNDFMLLSLAPVPVSIVNAGLDQDICKDRTEVFLNGTILVAGGGQWSVLNSPNPGTFLLTDTSLSARYQPTIEDKNQGAIKIALTTILNGVCGPSIDTMDIRFTDVPTVSINNSVPDTVCADVSSITFAGTVTVGRSNRWSTNGTGTFVPNPFAATVVYVPSDEDKVNGLLGVTLTSEENGNCVGEYFTNKTILIEKETKLRAGTDMLVCKNNPVVRLNGRVENAKPGAVYTWKSSSGLGIFSPPGATVSNNINTVFIPDNTDLENGAVLLTFSSTNNSKCEDKSSQFLMTFGPAPVLEAGPDRTLCVNNAAVFLAPSISGGASQGLWSSTGSGTFVEDPTSNATQYIPSAEDLDQPSVRLIIRTSDNTDGKCLPVSDTIRVNFTPAPRVTASSAFPCVYIDGVELSGTVTQGASQGVWKTSANGVFAPNPASLNSRYFPSDADKVQGDITVYLVSTNNGNCLPDSAELTLLVAPLPEANAGSDRFVCQGSNDTLFANPGLNYVYSWRQIGGAFTAGNLNKVSVGPINAPVQTYELRVDDNKGCSAFDTVNVRSVVNPNLSIDDKFCLVPSMKISASAPSAVTEATFQWFRDGILLQGANDTVLRVFQPGNYSINYSLGKCNVHNAQTRIIQPPILVTLDHIYCKEDLAVAEVRNLLQNPVTYAWTIDGVSIGGNSTTVSNIVTEDTTIFNVRVTDADGCFSKDSVFMLAKTRPVTALDLNSPGCKGESVVLNASPNPILSGAVRSWTKDGNLISDTSAIITVTETGLGAGRFIVRYALDRCVALDTADVVFNVLPTGPFAGRQQEFCSLTNITATLDANPNGLPNLRYKWLTPTNPVLNNFDTLRTYVVDSTGFERGNSKFYTVRLTNEFNCSSIDSIRLRDFCVPKIHIPTALTPNKDGVNDKLEVFGVEKFFKNFEMYIFNRWGEVIFKSTSPSVAWDGTYKGEIMPVGTYPYIVTYESTDPRDLTKYKNQGKVTVVR
ncbi:MAG: gliding motility-associated C-terminal domain-containing protein, partial [Cytophagales bacterium]